MFKEKYRAYQEHITSPEDFTEKLLRKKRRRKAIPIVITAPLCLLLIFYITMAGPDNVPKEAEQAILEEDALTEKFNREEIRDEASKDCDIPEQSPMNLNEGEFKLPDAILPPEGILIEEQGRWVLYTEKGAIFFALEEDVSEKRDNETENEGELVFVFEVEGVRVRVRPEKEELLEILYRAPFFLKEE